MSKEEVPKIVVCPKCGTGIHTDLVKLEQPEPDFDDLIDKPLMFYGVDNHTFKLGDYVFEAMEDENDGYRSMLDEVRFVPQEEREGISTFSRHHSPLSSSKGLMGRTTTQPAGRPDFNGYALVDADDHVWLLLGTSSVDEYYPCFTFEYSAKEPS
jgi:hypothetical protein